MDSHYEILTTRFSLRDFGGFRGHDFKVLAEILDRNLNLVPGVASPTCTHSGRLLDIINSVFCVRDT